MRERDPPICVGEEEDSEGKSERWEIVTALYICVGEGGKKGRRGLSSVVDVRNFRPGGGELREDRERKEGGKGACIGGWVGAFFFSLCLTSEVCSVESIQRPIGQVPSVRPSNLSVL